MRPDQVKLALDKAAYGDGETAKVTVTPPAAGKGYLLVEGSDGPLWWQEIEVPGEGKTFDIKLDPSWARHDLYVSAQVIYRMPEGHYVAATESRKDGQALVS